MHPTSSRQPTRHKALGEKRIGEGNGGVIDGQQTPVRQAAVGHNRKIKLNSNKPILRPEASVELRDRLIAELNELSSGRRCSDVGAPVAE